VRTKAKVKSPKIKVQGPIVESDSKGPISERLMFNSGKKAHRAGM
jgi:hypothetical protein